jgi:hypothetical protein
MACQTKTLSSSEMGVESIVDNPSYASVTALSARHSLKRARTVFDVNPQVAFIPKVDPIIAQRSLNRRRRMAVQQPPATHDGSQLQHQSNSSALVLVNNQQGDGYSRMEMKTKSGGDLKTKSGGDRSSSMALTTTTMKGGINNNTVNNVDDKASGVLVVSIVICVSARTLC